jgi:hypothetical protein
MTISLLNFLHFNAFTRSDPKSWRSCQALSIRVRTNRILIKGNQRLVQPNVPKWTCTEAEVFLANIPTILHFSLPIPPKLHSSDVFSGQPSSVDAFLSGCRPQWMPSSWLMNPKSMKPPEERTENEQRTAAFRVPCHSIELTSPFFSRIFRRYSSTLYPH